MIECSRQSVWDTWKGKDNESRCWLGPGVYIGKESRYMFLQESEVGSNQRQVSGEQPVLFHKLLKVKVSANASI